jgi:hypothetical protein
VYEKSLALLRLLEVLELLSTFGSMLPFTALNLYVVVVH